MKFFCANIILLLYSFSLFPLPLVFWEKASLPCVDNDKHYNHGLIVWDGDTVSLSNLSRACGSELQDDVIDGASVVVYDVTNQSSFDEAVTIVRLSAKPHMSHWLDRHVWRSPVMALVGSKADLLMDRKITYEVLSYYDFIHVSLPWK